MDAPAQNAFVSGWPKKARARIRPDVSEQRQVGTGGWFPRST